MPRPLALCLIGQGITHSPSPDMHAAAMAAMGIEGTYEIVDVAAPRLPAVLADLRAGRWQGANVTVPYKQALASVCDELGGDAATTGAVNTLTVRHGSIHGDSTDAAGFELGLSAAHLWPLEGATAVVLGAGGVAAAVALALSRVPTSRTTVVARRVTAARALVDRLGAVGVENLAVGLWDAEWLERLLRGAGIVVNATTAGVRDLPLEPAALRSSCTVADVRYRPRPVDLVSAARAAGLRACDGAEMLVQQGMASLRLWTGSQPAISVAREAVYASFGEMPPP
ncbi:MAG: shikimate dehydrogenase family protein [Candidatus Dormibacteria bacterium]